MKTVFAKGNHKTIEKLIKLRKKAQSEKAIRVALRIQAIMLSIEKYTTTKIARLLKINRTTLPIWIRNWNKYKEVGLLEGHRSGRKNKLSEVSKDKLYDIIESGPIAYGFNSGIWTSVIISEVIKNDFNIDYHPGHVRKLLKRIGFSVQRPNYHLKRGDPEKKSKWRRYSHPNLKKKPLQKERS